jgi:organic hydroperoxide reductase OsmC/OhrA
MSVRARTFTYDVSLDAGGTASSGRGGSPLPHEEEEWTPEHLVLAALSRCVMKSYRYHARRLGLEPTLRAEAGGTVTKREEDGRFAFVQLRVDVDVTVDPKPPDEDLRALRDKGERDCFIAASLVVKPDYHWTVNGEDLS